MALFRLRAQQRPVALKNLGLTARMLSDVVTGVRHAAVVVVSRCHSSLRAEDACSSSCNPRQLEAAGRVKKKPLEQRSRLRAPTREGRDTGDGRACSCWLLHTRGDPSFSGFVPWVGGGPVLSAARAFLELGHRPVPPNGAQPPARDAHGGHRHGGHFHKA